MAIISFTYFFYKTFVKLKVSFSYDGFEVIKVTFYKCMVVVLQLINTLLKKSKNGFMKIVKVRWK